MLVNFYQSAQCHIPEDSIWTALKLSYNFLNSWIACMSYYELIWDVTLYCCLLQVIYWCFQCQDCIALDGGMTDDWWLGKNQERSGCGLIKVLFQHFSWGTEENHKDLSQDSWFPSWDSNWASSELKSRVLPVDQSVQWQCVIWQKNIPSTLYSLFENL